MGVIWPVSDVVLQTQGVSAFSALVRGTSESSSATMQLRPSYRRYEGLSDARGVHERGDEWLRHISTKMIAFAGA